MCEIPGDLLSYDKVKEIVLLVLLLVLPVLVVILSVMANIPYRCVSIDRFFFVVASVFLAVVFVVCGASCFIVGS